MVVMQWSQNSSLTLLLSASLMCCNRFLISEGQSPMAVHTVFGSSCSISQVMASWMYLSPISMQSSLNTGNELQTLLHAASTPASNLGSETSFLTSPTVVMQWSQNSSLSLLLSASWFLMCCKKWLFSAGQSPMAVQTVFGSSCSTSQVMAVWMYFSPSSIQSVLNKGSELQTLFQAAVTPASNLGSERSFLMSATVVMQWSQNSSPTLFSTPLLTVKAVEAETHKATRRKLLNSILS